MKRDLVYTTGELPTRPLDATRFLTPSPHQNRCRRPRVEKVGLTPQKRRERTLTALVTQLDGLSRREPVLMVYEDVHWSDPTTRESLDLLIDRVSGLRVLVIITFRPEFNPP
jgi:hypothetical protein